MHLIVGLGNPGDKYKHTRHNAGFMALDFYLKGANFTQEKKFFAQVLKKENIVFLKPETFMNDSGKSVRAVRDFYKIEKIFIIHDDLDLKLGALRFKIGGGNGGHNGLKSIDESIGENYIRARIGIGKPNSLNLDSNNLDSKLKNDTIINYVLNDFSNTESRALDDVFVNLNLAIDLFLGDKNIAEIQSKCTLKAKNAL